MSKGGKRHRPSFVGFVLIGLAIVIIALIAGGRGGMTFGVKGQDFGRLVYLAALLVFIASGLIGRALKPGEIVRAIFGWTAIFLLAVGVYTYRVELAGVGGRLLGALAPGVPLSGQWAGAEGKDVVVVRAPDGHFAVRGSVNDRPVTFLVDTGASFVTLAHDDASALGIDVDRLSYAMPIRTANGPMSAAAIRLDSLAIGPIERHDVRALVAPADALDQSLLGMTFLDTLASYAISGDRLMLTP